MDFKPGDVVVLKSGGPLMTVEAVEPDRVYCIWFEGSAIKRDRFLPAVLEKQQ